MRKQNSSGSVVVVMVVVLALALIAAFGITALTGKDHKKVVTYQVTYGVTAPSVDSPISHGDVIDFSCVVGKLESVDSLRPVIETMRYDGYIGFFATDNTDRVDEFVMEQVTPEMLRGLDSSIRDKTLQCT